MTSDAGEPLQRPGHPGPTHTHTHCARRRLGSSCLPMNWTTPSYEELKMDAEIGSYQQDDDVPPIVETRDSERDAE